jgi:hypothetical protein
MIFPHLPEAFPAVIGAANVGVGGNAHANEPAGERRKSADQETGRAIEGDHRADNKERDEDEGGLGGDRINV